ncbi:hypothetical protein JYU14_05345 [Simkania negevensis]|uniref:Uncharacterized protein n=1 Tax=Simkania negevensis TaxID=83561 RepID=A0ABS3ARX7_9BACT|nr:hypothetical protein [Simkania negevensis]
MLKKLSGNSEYFTEGQAVFLVTRTGEIHGRYYIDRVLFPLVSFASQPIEGSLKQGFTIEGQALIPNWCEGRRTFVCAVASEEKAKELSAEIQNGTPLRTILRSATKEGEQP